MTKLRLLVVDDELLARERIRSLLRQQTDVEIIGECANGRDAAIEIQRLHPDVVLLDINMPGLDGLQVAASLPPGERPAIIFVTAHDRYAVDAFGVQAVDYVLKPFDAERLGQALERAREQVRSQRSEALGEKLEALLVDKPAPRKPDRLLVKTDGRVVFVRPEEIVWVEAANNYSLLHLADGRRLMFREAIGVLEQRLGTAQFARISRSAIVRLDHIQELQPTPHGDYVVLLRDGRRLALSRQLRSRFDIFAPGGL